MKSYDKREIAASMFVEASNIFKSAASEMDYIKCILLSGAVVGIAEPLIVEKGGKSTHQILADISNHLSDSNQSHKGLFRETYNSLKHSGKPKEQLPASEDLVIETDLKVEAARMLDAAKDDLLKVEFTQAQLNELGEKFLDLIQSMDSYA